MAKNHRAGGRPSGATGGWKGSLAAVLKAHNGARHDGAVASFATQDKRADVLYAGFKSLHALGFRMDSAASLRGKHIEALAKDWHARGLSASTLQNTSRSSASSRSGSARWAWCEMSSITWDRE